MKINEAYIYLSFPIVAGSPSGHQSLAHSVMTTGNDIELLPTGIVGQIMMNDRGTKKIFMPYTSIDYIEIKE